MSRAARSRDAFLRIAPKLAGTAGRILTGLRTTASTMHPERRPEGEVRRRCREGRHGLGTGDPERCAWRRARDRRRIRSALGGVGEAVVAFLSSLLGPAREALARLRQAGAEVLLDGIKQVRAAAAKAVAFVKEDVVTRLDAALAAAVGLVRDLAKAALERARRAKAANDRRFAAVRAGLGAARQVTRGLLARARTTLITGFSNGTRLVATAISNGGGQLATRLGRRTFFRQAKMWRTVVREPAPARQDQDRRERDAREALRQRGEDRDRNRAGRGSRQLQGDAHVPRGGGDDGDERGCGAPDVRGRGGTGSDGRDRRGRHRRRDTDPGDRRRRRSRSPGSPGARRPGQQMKRWHQR